MRSFAFKCGLFFLCFSTAFAASSNTLGQQRFNIRLKQAPLVATLQQLALDHQTNLIIDDELEGTISLQLNATNLDQLLHSVAKIKQLNLWQEDGIYYLNQKDNELNKDVSTTDAFDRFPSLQAPEAVPTLVTTSIKLHYAKASEVMKSLTGGSGSLLSANGNLTFDDRSNLLLIQDEKPIVNQIKKLVAELDKPIEQIAIEARIVTISDENLKELGVRWGIFNPSGNSHKMGGSLEGNGFTSIAEQLNINFASPTTPAGSVALQVAKINGRLLDLELTALERENNVEIIASPRLLTTNKKSASIKQGTEIPYVITNGDNDTQSVEFREAVLGLEVTPHISQGNTILLDLLVSQNSPSGTVAYGQSEVVSIDKQEISTQVFAHDGETIVLGGVFHDTISKGVDKVPLLGDIPGLKRLFSRESERHQKRELVIFVTPHILQQGKPVEKMARTPIPKIATSKISASKKNNTKNP